jgi:hypothetical protein
VSNGLDVIAIAALDDPTFETTRGFCQRFVKEVVFAKYGFRFFGFAKGSAHASMLAWQTSPYALPGQNSSIPGDILYYREKFLRKNGHVVIRIAGNLVAENSTAHKGGARGGKGTRALSRLGTPDLIVRLP